MPGIESIAIIAPRFPGGDTVGGAETLLKNLALRASQQGLRVSFLTTCAKSHFTWENELPPGVQPFESMTVHYFPVDADRDVTTFLSVQQAISNGRTVSREEEDLWLQNSVNSRALCDHLRTEGDQYDRILVGPYLFGLCYAAAKVHPEKTLLVPCLHDEPFAYLEAFKALFSGVRGILFNTEPERSLGCRIYPLDLSRTAVVGMGLDPFKARGGLLLETHGLTAPYLLYSGRREPLKGTPLLLDYMAAFRARTGRDIKLVLTGSGPVEPPDDLRPHVLDLGFVSEEDKHRAMAGALAFCHPSVNESLGIVLLESWLAGRPGLVHAGSEVLRYQCRQSHGGLWFRTYPEFEEALERLADDAEMAAAMGQQGRDYVLREYSWEKVAKRLRDALEGL